MTPTLPTSEAAAPAAREVERVTVTADRLTWVGGRLEAQGRVVVAVGEDVLEAERASGTAAELLIEAGVWHRASGEVRFATARVNLSARSGVVTDAQLKREGVTVDAGRISLDDEAGLIRAESARFEPCACADGHRPALSFRARAVELIGARVAVIHGGTVRVFDVPVLPVPYWREPLDPRQFRLLLPQVSFGSLGWSASEHARFGAGPELVEVGPAWREDRGGRLDVALAGPVAVEGAVGWDSTWGSPRGAGVTRAGFADAHQRLAWDVTAQSDSLYAEDYGPSWVDRGVGWHDSRALGQVGPLRATAWLPDDGSASRYATLRVRPEFSRTGWAAAPFVEAGLAGAPYVLAGGDAHGSHTWTALHTEAVVVAAGVAELDAGGTAFTQAIAAGMGRAEVPFWGEIAGKRVQFFAGARVEAELADALTAPLHITPSLDGSGFGAGPSARASSLIGDTLLTAEAAGLLGADGQVTPWAAAEAANEAWTARVQINDDGAVVQVQTHGLVAADVGTLLTDDARLGWADVTWHPGRLVVGGGVSRGFAAEDPLTGAARLGYDDGCSSLLLNAAFSPDRELPDVGLALALRK